MDTVYIDGMFVNTGSIIASTRDCVKLSMYIPSQSLLHLSNNSLNIHEYKTALLVTHTL